MRRIAIINQKGGVGKTTTTANLGAALALFGKRVLLIDLDPQAHLSLHFGTELSDEQAGVYDVLTSSAPLRDVAQQVRKNITLIPADIDLAGVEAELVSTPGRELILREAVEDAAYDHDVLLIDCPPSLGTLTINALVAVDEVMIPLQSQFFALQGLGKLLDTIKLVQRRINPRLRVTGVILCMHEALTRLAGEVVDDLSSFLASSRETQTPWSQATLYKSFIRRNVKLAEACSFGKTIFDYAPKSNGARDYARLTAEAFSDLGVDSARILDREDVNTVPAPARTAGVDGACAVPLEDGDDAAQPAPAQHPTGPRPPVLRQVDRAASCAAERQEGTPMDSALPVTGRFDGADYGPARAMERRTDRLLDATPTELGADIRATKIHAADIGVTDTRIADARAIIELPKDRADAQSPGQAGPQRSAIIPP